MKKYIFIAFLVVPFTFYSQNKNEIDFIVKKYDRDYVKSVSNYIDSLNLDRNKSIVSFLNANVSSPKEIYKEGELFSKIFQIIENRPVYMSITNDKAAKSTRANFLHTGGSLGLNINGEGMNIATWDGGPTLVSHTEFLNPSTSSSRILTPDASASNSQSLHSTHVSGTIVARGVNSLAKGMAPFANLKSFDWDNDEQEVLVEATSNGLLISNHSYGVPVLLQNGNQNAPTWFMGCYSSDARAWDLISHAAPYYLMVASAGNDGNSSYNGGLLAGYDKLTGNKNSKNNLVVANAQDAVLHPNGSGNLLGTLFINSSSSQGPSDDGRIKPDITGNGTDVFSTSNTTNFAYATLTGTSMAAPNVSGTLLLLQQYYNELNGNFMRSATLKALACHTADEAGNIGPDPIFGWGLLNAKKAAETIFGDNEPVPSAIISELTLNQGETYSFQVSAAPGTKLEATICWTDPAGIARDSQLNSPSPALVNDLDLRISQASTVFFPWRLQLSNVAASAIKGDNVVDNVENVEVDSPNGIYTITVSHKGSLAAGSQNFSLIVTGTSLVNLSQSTIDDENSFVLYPNPANDFIGINLGTVEADSYDLIDIQGRVIISNSLVGKTNDTISLSGLQSGVYFVKVNSGTYSITKKVIKN